MIREAESALQAAQARLQQAQAEVNEARQMLQAAEAELQTAQTELEQIETAIRSTQAEVEYWQAESERQNALLQKGFVSKRDAQAAETRLKQARESLQSAQASQRAQRSRIEQLQANREAMRARVKRAGSARRAVEQEVQASAARLQAARARRQRAEANLKAQQGSARAAQLQVDYTRLASLNPGVITERLTEPGTLVQPGTPVFKLQNTSQIRVQAKVAEQDAVRIREGYPVWIRRYAEPNRVYQARVSAIFREADPNTRTMIVEAVLSNPDGRFVVGEYAEVRIGLLPRATSATTIPVRALQYDEFQQPYVWVMTEASHQRHSHPTVYTCPMHPQIERNQPGKCPICKMDLVPKEQPARYIARKRRVQPGLSDGERVRDSGRVETGRAGDCVRLCYADRGRPRVPHPVDGARTRAYQPAPVPTFPGRAWALNTTMCRQNNTIRRVVLPPRPLPPSLRNLRLTRQQSVARSAAGKSEVQRIGRAQPCLDSEASGSDKDFATSGNQLQRLEKHAETLLQSLVSLLQRFYWALHQRQIAGVEDRLVMCLQLGANLGCIRGILNTIEDDACIQVNSGSALDSSAHNFYSSTLLSHESRSARRYASTSPRDGGGTSDGKFLWITLSVSATSASEPLGNRTVLLVRRSHCSRMSRASSSGLQRRWAARSRRSCQSCSSSSIVNLGRLLPKEDYTCNENLQLD